MVNNKDLPTALVGLLFVVLGIYAAFPTNKISTNFITFITFSGFVVVLFDFISNSLSSKNSALVKYGFPVFIIIFVAILCSINEGGLYGLININEATINSINNASTLLAFGLSLLILSNTFIRATKSKHMIVRTESTENSLEFSPLKGYMQVTKQDKSNWFKHMYGKKLMNVNFPWPWVIKDFKQLPNPGDLFIIQEENQFIFCKVMEFELYKDTNTIWDEHETRDINCGFQNINNLNSFVKNKSKVTNIKLIILGFENDTFFKKLNTTQIENLNSYGLKTFDITSEIRDYLNNKLIKN